MLAYIGRRALLAVFTVWAISVLSFVIIQLPPGDYVTSYIAQMASMGSVVTDEEAQNLRIQYGLGQPIYVQYFKWMKQIVRGNFGMSMEWRRPVTEVIGERLWLTVVVSVAALHPHLGAGAAHRHLLRGPAVLHRRLRRHVHRLHRPGRPQLPARAGAALLRASRCFNANIGGLFSPELQDAPWSLAQGRGTCSSTCRSRR